MPRPITPARVPIAALAALLFALSACGGGPMVATGSVRRLLGFRPGLPPFDWPGAGTPWTGTTTFPQAGCWRVDVQRGGLTGQLWLRAS